MTLARVACCYILWACVGVVCGETLPYEVTPSGVAKAMLLLANAGPRTVFVDLGCGEGDVVRRAAAFGVKRAVGVDYNATLIARARELTSPDALRNGSVEFVHRDFVLDGFGSLLSDATVVFLYWIPTFVSAHGLAVVHALRPGAVIMSHDYPFVDLDPPHSSGAQVDCEASAEWQTDNLPQKIRISGIDYAYLYKYAISKTDDDIPVRRGDHETLVSPRCVRRQTTRNNGIATFRLQHSFVAAGVVSSSTVAYSQWYTSKNKGVNGYRGPIHLVVQNDTLVSLWIEGAAAAPNPLAFKVVGFFAGDGGTETSATTLAEGINKQTKDAKSGPWLENLSLTAHRVATLPLNVTVQMRVVTSVATKKAKRNPHQRSSSAAGPPSSELEGRHSDL